MAAACRRAGTSTDVNVNGTDVNVNVNVNDERRGNVNVGGRCLRIRA